MEIAKNIVPINVNVIDFIFVSLDVVSFVGIDTFMLAPLKPVTESFIAVTVKSVR